MIKYKLICKDCNKIFDSWFSNSKEYEKLKKRKYLNCHFCDSNKVEKTLMAPNILNNSDFKKKDININEGEIYLLPANVPHSPQRTKNSVGLVVEKTRKPTDLDGFQWYCDNCDNLIYEKFSQVSDIVNQLPIIFDEFWNNLNNRTCKKCNQILEK